MAYFYRFQRVRIVKVGVYPEMLGRECTLMSGPEQIIDSRRHSNMGWETDIPHPKPPPDWPDAKYAVANEEIEPLQFPGEEVTEEELELVLK